MEFDRSRVYTALTADEVKPGSKGYYADCLADLETKVRLDNKHWYAPISGINPATDIYRFKMGTPFEVEHAALFYLVEEPGKEKLRPYRDTNEMIECFGNHFNLLLLNHRPPMMWVRYKTTDKVYLITRFTKDTVTLCLRSDIVTLNLKVLADSYTWFDGASCGVAENKEI